MPTANEFLQELVDALVDNGFHEWPELNLPNMDRYNVVTTMAFVEAPDYRPINPNDHRSSEVPLPADLTAMAMVQFLSTASTDESVAGDAEGLVVVTSLAGGALIRWTAAFSWSTPIKVICFAADEAAWQPAESAMD